MATVLPVLHHPSAFDIDQYASRFLLDTELEVPVVSYLRMDEGEPADYITWETIEKRKVGLQKVDQRAREELQNRPNRSGWNPASVAYRGGEAVVMRCIGDFFTASDILDPEMLGIVHNYYRKDTVYVAIPHACCLIAADVPEYIATKFYPAFDEAIQEGVEFVEQIYQIDDGKITRILGITPTVEPPEMRDVKGNRILWFTLPYRGNFEQLLVLIRSELEAYVPQFIHNADFSGRIVVELPENAPEFSQKQLDELKVQEAHANQLSASQNWKSPAGQDVVIRFKYPQRSKTVEVKLPDSLDSPPLLDEEISAIPAPKKKGTKTAVAEPQDHTQETPDSGPEEPRKKKKKIKSKTKSRVDMGDQAVTTSTLTVPRNMARRAPKAKVPTNHTATAGSINLDLPQSSLPYDVLKDKIPNKLGVTILCLRLMYMISASSALLGGIGILALFAKEDLAIGIGFFVGSLVFAAIIYVINEWVFVRGLKKCNPTIRLVLLIFSVMGMLSIINIFSYFIFFGLIHDGTKKLFAEAENLANTAAP